MATYEGLGVPFIHSLNISAWVAPCLQKIYVLREREREM